MKSPFRTTARGIPLGAFFRVTRNGKIYKKEANGIAYVSAVQTTDAQTHLIPNEEAATRLQETA